MRLIARQRCGGNVDAKHCRVCFTRNIALRLATMRARVPAEWLRRVANASTPRTSRNRRRTQRRNQTLQTDMTIALGLWMCPGQGKISSGA